jgi:hypothetical protein
VPVPKTQKIAVLEKSQSYIRQMEELEQPLAAQLKQIDAAQASRGALERGKVAIRQKNLRTPQ